MKNNAERNNLYKKMTAVILSVFLVAGIFRISAGAASAELKNTFRTPLEFNVPSSEFKIEGNTISPNMSEEMMQTVSRSVTEITQIAFDAFIQDHPDLAMWFKPPKSIYSISPVWDGVSERGTLRISGISSIFESREHYDDPLGMYDFLNSEILAFVPEGTTRYDKVRYTHDYLCRINVYDGDALHAYSSFGSMIDHRSVCEGYAEAFKLICDNLGIPCILVCGRAYSSAKDTVGEAHMWNYVMMEDGNWYGVDATWDDVGSGKTTYLLVGSDTQVKSKMKFSDSHKPDGDISGTGIKTFTYPALSKSAYTPKEETVGASEAATHYFYDQLNDEQKNFYDGLLSMQIPSGTPTCVTTTAPLPTSESETTSDPQTSSESQTPEAQTQTETETIPANTAETTTEETTETSVKAEGNTVPDGVQTTDDASVTSVQTTAVKNKKTETDTEKAVSGTVKHETETAEVAVVEKTEDTEEETGISMIGESDTLSGTSAETGGEEASGLTVRRVLQVSVIGIALILLVGFLGFTVIRFTKNEKKSGK